MLSGINVITIANPINLYTPRTNHHAAQMLNFKSQWSGRQCEFFIWRQILLQVQKVFLRRISNAIHKRIDMTFEMSIECHLFVNKIMCSFRLAKRFVVIPAFTTFAANWLYCKTIMHMTLHFICFWTYTVRWSLIPARSDLRHTAYQESCLTFK